MHQHRVAAHRIGALEQVGPYGKQCLRQCRRLDQVIALRHRQALPRGRQGILRITAPGQQRTDALPDQQLAALPGRHDRAGYFQPRNVRSAGRRRIFALPLQHVGPVHPGGGHADQHLVIARDRHWPRLRHQRIRPTGHGNGDRHHLARYAVAIGHRRFPPKPAHAASHQNRPAECAPLLTEWPAGSTLPFMDKDDDLPHRADDPLARLLMQDLDPLSVAELDARIAALKAEIARTEAKMEYAVNHKAIAEALFKR